MQAAKILETTDKKQTPNPIVFEHTPTVEDKKYEFNKPSGHYTALEKDELAEPNANYKEKRELKIAVKTEKKEASEHRNKQKWAKVTYKEHSQLMKDKAITKEGHNLAFESMVANSEMYNFLLGSVKYRTDGTSVYSVLELGFEGLDDKLIANPDSLPIFEDMGRAVATKWVHEEDDLNLDNIGVDQDGLCRVIDHGRTYATLTNPYYFVSNEPIHKLVQYPVGLISGYPYKKKLRFLDEYNNETWELRGQDKEGNPITSTFMGELHLDDFEGLPKVKHRTPMNWGFNDKAHARDYAERAARDPRFIGEKCLQVFKEIIVKNTTLDFDRIHTREPDRSKRQARKEKNIQDAFEIALKSPTFLLYLKKHFAAAVKIILYEVRDHICSNKHYRAKDQKQDEANWNKKVNLIFDRIKLVMEKAGQGFSEAQEKELKNFADKLRCNDQGAIQAVREIYAAQGAKIRAERVHPLVFKPNAPKAPLPPDTTGLVDHNTFKGAPNKGATKTTDTLTPTAGLTTAAP